MPSCKVADAFLATDNSYVANIRHLEKLATGMINSNMVEPTHYFKLIGDVGELRLGDRREAYSKLYDQSPFNQQPIT